MDFREIVRACLWAAIMLCPDDRWDSLCPSMRASAMMALQPARY